MKNQITSIITTTLSILILISCSPSENIIATYINETKIAWTIQPTYTFYPTYAIRPTNTFYPTYTIQPETIKEITNIVIFTKTSTSTLTPTNVPTNVWATNGPSGGVISIIEIDQKNPTTVFAGLCGKGSFKSTNGGLTWNKLEFDFDGNCVSDLAFDPGRPTTIFASAHFSLYKSIDGGENWLKIKDTNFTNTGPFYFLAIDPKTPSTMYAYTNSKVYKSINSGIDWFKSNTGIPDNISSIDSIAIDPLTPTTLYVGGSFYCCGSAGSDGVLYKSTNGGGEWHEVNYKFHDDNKISILIDSKHPTTIYIGTFSGIFKSTNGGDSWFLVNTGLTSTYIDTLAIDPLNPSTLYAGTQNGGVSKSTNGGGNWFAVNAGFPPEEDIFSLAIDPVTPTTLYAGTDEGVYFIHQAHTT
jgi:photosystem II stability/assembly factor-like uncharacterized protein